VGFGRGRETKDGGAPLHDRKFAPARHAPVIIYLIVDDVDAFVDRAVDAGTKIVMTARGPILG